MDSSTILIIAIPVLLLLAAVAVVAEGRRRSNVGRLSRETTRRDRSEPAVEVEPATGTDLAELDEEARERAREARQQLEPTAARPPAERVPVDEEELGITRRQLFNRGILGGLAIFAGGMGAAMLGFLWPSSAGGFGAKIVVGTTDDTSAAFDKKQPFYNATAKTYIVPYPKPDVPKAQKIYDPQILEGMKLGYVALYQKCVHLGCRVPFCESSQWFECPCHGSKYNRVGEKRGGPAPRGLDRFPLQLQGNSIQVDTGTIVLGPPIGTDTTGQSPEGALCV